MPEEDLDATVLMPRDDDITLVMPIDPDATVLQPIKEKRKGEILFLPGQSPEGKYILSVLLKRTYDICPDKSCKRSKEDRNFISGDTPWGNPIIWR